MDGLNGNVENEPLTSDSSNSGQYTPTNDKYGSSRTNLQSSFVTSLSDCECLDENIVIDEITETEPTAAVLSYCKRMFYRPFVVFLSLAGLKPMSVDPDWKTLFGHLITMIVLALLIIGYCLQYLSGFRRDKEGFDPQAAHLPKLNVRLGMFLKLMINTGEVVFVYLVPALIHLSGYLVAVFIYRVADCESLQSLSERVFILAEKPKRLICNFWFYTLCGAGWLACSMAYIFVVAGNSSSFIKMEWFVTLPDSTKSFFMVLFHITLFTHDLIQVVIITSYCLHCYLLRQYLASLKEKLLLHTIEPLDWMRETCEFKKLLRHLNTKIALPVCFLTVLNLSYVFSSIVHLFRDMTTCPVTIFSLSTGNICLWLLLAITPIYQASLLTMECRSTQSCGHLISIRPFVHRNTTTEDLNTILLYASSLKMSAKLFKMPISTQYLFFAVVVCVVCVLTFGMCINIRMGL